MAEIEGFEAWKGEVERGVAERSLGGSDAAQSYNYEEAFAHGRSSKNAVRDIRDGRQFESAYDEVVEEQEKQQRGRNGAPEEETPEEEAQG